MEFSSKLVRYLTEIYPQADGWAWEVFYEHHFQDLCTTHGITEVRKALREAGVKRVPRFSQDYKGYWLPTTLLTLVTINDELHPVFYKWKTILNGYDSNMVQVSLGNYVTKDRVNFYPDETGQSYSIFDWIDFGDECTECGAPFMRTGRTARHTECSVCRGNSEPLSYSTRAEDVLGDVPSKEIRYGIELEYEDVTARDVTRNLRWHAIAKRDGSIGNGVEVVTKPAPMAEHKEKLKTFFENVRTQSFPNTGMHVHIERSKLNEFRIGFIMQFLNTRANKDKLIKVAGRDYTENTYCRMQDGHTMTWGLHYSGKLHRSQTDKYSPLNTAKDKTIEIRIFSSPESQLECAAKLEFVEGLVAYSSPYAVDVKRLKDKFEWNTFQTFMFKNKKHYPHFYAYFEGVL